ncbi:DUF3467 domain-containing protein [Candidatus Peregrinibacteria bacterium]|nr:DUF3467 domain-containing protein [Candidatus Peregrinibacteria bacterium]
MSQNNPPKGDQKAINLRVDPAMEQGVFSNAISIHVNQNEVVIDFGYMIPNQNPVTIKLVGRMNLTHQTAESLMNVLSNAMLDWRNKQKNN